MKKKVESLDLSFDDIKNHKAKLHEVRFLGKRAFIKEIPYGMMMVVAERFSGRESDEAKDEDMKYLIACCLCDKEGKLICPKPEDGVKFFTDIESSEMIELFDKISNIDIQLKDSEKN